MVSIIEELRKASELLRKLLYSKREHDVKIGMMVETPSTTDQGDGARAV
jgi:phosphoenolpyruvate-protein kinase (PTS system EI component)